MGSLRGRAELGTDEVALFHQPWQDRLGVKSPSKPVAVWFGRAPEVVRSCCRGSVLFLLLVRF